MEDDLSMFLVQTWTWHVKLGGSDFYVFLHEPLLLRYDGRRPFHFLSGNLDSAGEIRVGPPFTVF